MQIVDNIKSFLYDKKYFINIYDDYIHIFNYNSLDKFTTTEILLAIDNIKYVIKGKNFFISKMLINELLIKGDFCCLEKYNE